MQKPHPCFQGCWPFFWPGVVAGDTKAETKLRAAPLNRGAGHSQLSPPPTPHKAGLQPGGVRTDGADGRERCPGSLLLQMNGRRKIVISTALKMRECVWAAQKCSASPSTRIPITAPAAPQVSAGPRSLPAG